MTRAEGMDGFHVRGVRLEDICDASENQTSDKSPIESTFPAFLLILLTWLHAEKPAGWRVVVVAITSAKAAPGRESLNVQWPAERATGAKALRKQPSGHFEVYDGRLQHWALCSDGKAGRTPVSDGMAGLVEGKSPEMKVLLEEERTREQLSGYKSGDIAEDATAWGEGRSWLSAKVRASKPQKPGDYVTNEESCAAFSASYIRLHYDNLSVLA